MPPNLDLFLEKLIAGLVLEYFPGFFIGSLLGLYDFTFMYGLLFTVTIYSGCLLPKIYNYWIPADYLFLKTFPKINDLFTSFENMFTEEQIIKTLHNFLKEWPSIRYTIGYTFGFSISNFIFNFLGLGQTVIILTLLLTIIKYENMKKIMKKHDWLPHHSHLNIFIGISMSYTLAITTESLLRLFWKKYGWITMILLVFVLIAKYVFGMSVKEMKFQLISPIIDIYGIIKLPIINIAQNFYLSLGMGIGGFLFLVSLFYGTGIAITVFLVSSIFVLKYHTTPKITPNSSLHPQNLTIFEENQDLPVCHICMEESEHSYVLLECGHLPFCNECSSKIIESNPKICPVCRSKVIRRLRTYF